MFWRVFQQRLVTGCYYLLQRFIISSSRPIGSITIRSLVIDRVIGCYLIKRLLTVFLRNTSTIYMYIVGIGIKVTSCSCTQSRSGCVDQFAFTPGFQAQNTDGSHSVVTSDGRCQRDQRLRQVDLRQQGS